MKQLLIHLRISIIATIVLAIIVSGFYPVIVWGLAQLLFHHQANGSLIKKDGTPTDNDADAVGSSLLGQPFSDEKYFHPRPSAAGNGYDATASGGTNLGPLSAKLLNGTTQPSTQPSQPPTVAYDGIKLRTILYAQENNIDIVDASQPLKTFQDDKGNYDQVKLITAFNDSDHPLMFRTSIPIPPDAVTASASGLDPHISVANAELQAKHVADARKISVDQVKALIPKYTDGPDLGILGDPGVNVLKLNVALDNEK
ncbi:MAG TPA: potassium-transporting ATPase subunit C [Tepidisphaeraceae bacterium]|nr:potassium-transporting ATPase subunit C [Tepidisphaeraceae bacterium]